MKQTCAVIVLAVLAGCGGDEVKQPAPAAPAPVAPAPAPVKPSVPKKVMAPPLTDAQNTAVKAAFDTARGFVKQADALKLQGDNLVKAQGAAAANDTYVKAKDLYHQAVMTVSDWTDGDLGGKVTDAQRDDYLGDYTREVSRWQKAMSDLGKIHKDN